MAKKCICFSRVSSYRQDLDYQRNEVKAEALKTYKSSEIIEVTGKESAIKLSEEQILLDITSEIMIRFKLK